MFNYAELIKRLEESVFSQATKGDQSFMKKTSRGVKSDNPGMKPQGTHLDVLKAVRPISNIGMRAELLDALHPKTHGPVKALAKGDLDFSDLSRELQKILYDYWLDHGMPYGIAKARTGDPYQWITDKMHELFEETRPRTRRQSIVHEAKIAAQEKQAARPEKDDETDTADKKTDKKTDKKKKEKDSTGKKDTFNATPTMTPLAFRGVLPL